MLSRQYVAVWLKGELIVLCFPPKDLDQRKYKLFRPEFELSAFLFSTVITITLSTTHTYTHTHIYVCVYGCASGIREIIVYVIRNEHCDLISKPEKGISHFK